MIVDTHIDCLLSKHYNFILLNVQEKPKTKNLIVRLDSAVVSAIDSHTCDLGSNPTKVNHINVIL